MFAVRECNQTVFPTSQGILLVYEITSKASYDLIVSLRQKIALKNKEVRFYHLMYIVTSCTHTHTYT